MNLAARNYLYSVRVSVSFETHIVTFVVFEIARFALSVCHLKERLLRWFFLLFWSMLFLAKYGTTV